MKNIMEYKGFIGSIEFSMENEVYFGKVQGVRALISYEGETVQELHSDFQDAVDDYLMMCAEEGIEAEIAYQDVFHFPISAEVHSQTV